MKVITAQELKDTATSILTSAGVTDSEAALVADHLTEANLKGRDSHGISRLVGLVKGLENGAIHAGTNMTILKETPAMALIDANHSIGQIVALKAMDMAIEKAKKVGIGIVSMRNASHIGFLGYYAEKAAKQGTIGILFTNTEPAMSASGGAEPVLGTNPICVGIPTKGEPMVVDMATSVVARGKIMEHERNGKPIPKGWAIDKDGSDTEDPSAALAGSLLPIAGPKGYCLAFAFDLLSGALAGAAVGTDVKGTAHADEVCTKGDLFLAIDPELFNGSQDFLDRVEQLGKQVKSSKKASGVTQILLPGDPELTTKEKRLKEGIAINEKLWQQLTEMKG
ncbi:MAG: Ldh family oxidoreductase [Deltaproteobacteria bacterium]|nr:Ldh family oxidoreductase [Deltaproteobacteria bacterium]